MLAIVLIICALAVLILGVVALRYTEPTESEKVQAGTVSPDYDTATYGYILSQLGFNQLIPVMIENQDEDTFHLVVPLKNLTIKLRVPRNMVKYHYDPSPAVSPNLPMARFSFHPTFLFVGTNGSVNWDWVLENLYRVDIYQASDSNGL